MKFKCPMTNHIIEVHDPADLPDGHVFERVSDDVISAPATPYSGEKRVYQPLSWIGYGLAAGAGHHAA